MVLVRCILDGGVVKQIGVEEAYWKETRTRRGAAIEKVDVVSLNPIGAVETPEKLDPCLRVVGEGPKQPRRPPVSGL